MKNVTMISTKTMRQLRMFTIPNISKKQICSRLIQELIGQFHNSQTRSTTTHASDVFLCHVTLTFDTKINGLSGFMVDHVYA